MGKDNHNQIYTWLGSAVFGLTVFVGMLFILGSKLSGFPAWVVTSIPILVMCSYAAAMFLPALKLRDDQTGDNLYYMGFLYTLTSLGVSLYQFSASGSAEQIVQSFGVAIGSTIAGIALRVAFAQMRKDPVEVEREARLELAEAARRVRRELDATVMEMSAFQRTTVQVIHDGFRSVQENVDRVTGTLVEALQQTAEKAKEPLLAASNASAAAIEAMGTQAASRLDGLGSTIGQRLDSTSQRMEAENDRMSDAASKVAVALDGLAGRLTSMQTPDKVVEVKLDPLLKPLIKRSADLSHQSEQATLNFERHSERIGKVAEAMDLLSQRMAETAGLTAANAVDQRKIFEALDQFADRVVGALSDREKTPSFDRMADFEARLLEAIAANRSVPEVPAAANDPATAPHIANQETLLRSPDEMAADIVVDPSLRLSGT